MYAVSASGAAFATPTTLKISAGINTVSYTHMTLPTILLV